MTTEGRPHLNASPLGATKYLKKDIEYLFLIFVNERDVECILKI